MEIHLCRSSTTSTRGNETPRFLQSATWRTWRGDPLAGHEPSQLLPERPGSPLPCRKERRPVPVVLPHRRKVEGFSGGVDHACALLWRQGARRWAAVLPVAAAACRRCCAHPPSCRRGRSPSRGRRFCLQELRVQVEPHLVREDPLEIENHLQTTDMDTRTGRPSSDDKSTRIRQAAGRRSSTRSSAGEVLL